MYYFSGDPTYDAPDPERSKRRFSEEVFLGEAENIYLRILENLGSPSDELREGLGALWGGIAECSAEGLLRVDEKIAELISSSGEMRMRLTGIDPTGRIQLRRDMHNKIRLRLESMRSDGTLFQNPQEDLEPMETNRRVFEEIGRWADISESEAEALDAVSFRDMKALLYSNLFNSLGGRHSRGVLDELFKLIPEDQPITVDTLKLAWGWGGASATVSAYLDEWGVCLDMHTRFVPALVDTVLMMVGFDYDSAHEGAISVHRVL